MEQEHFSAETPRERFEGNTCEVRKLDDVDEGLEKEIGERMAAFGFGEDDREKMTLAVREAAINGIKWGNREDPAKGVKIDLDLDEASDTLTVRVTDEGPGFSLEDAPDPLSEEHLLDEGGRGLLIMKEWFDEVRVEGSTVVLVKKRKEKPAE